MKRTSRSRVGVTALGAVLGRAAENTPVCDIPHVSSPMTDNDEGYGTGTPHSPPFKISTGKESFPPNLQRMGEAVC